MNYIDLRDIIENKKEEPEEYMAWAEAFGGTGKLQKQADNESLMIPEYLFENYARECAEDIGAITKDSQWPTNCIDWEQAANELQSDYSKVEVDGETYYYR